MKHPIRTGLKCVILAGTLATLTSGCLTQQPPTAVVSTEPVVTTTPVVSTLPTGQVVTNQVVATNFVTVTNYVAAPVSVNTNSIAQIVAGIQTAGGVVTAINPAVGMSITTVGGLLGTLLLGISTGVMTYKNQTSKNILTAVIAGVEGAPPNGCNDATPLSTSAVKASIQASATAAGVQPELNKIVQANT